ncbi:hypothetical protein NMG60_11002551 [Bertholletia excelsa]
MEHTSLAVVAKRLWNIVRVLFFMLRKGIAKRRLIADLNMIMKRGNKIAGKAIHNLMFNHSGSNQRHHIAEYEFSCSNSPAFPFHLKKRHHHHHPSHFFACAHAPITADDDKVATANALRAALEMLNGEAAVAASPALPGFGQSPAVRQLRITDSPFPLRDAGDGGKVDEAAEKFIERFYDELRKQQNVLAFR